MRLLAEEVLHELLDLRHARLAAHEHDLVDRLGLDAGVLEALFHRTHRPLDEVVHELLEPGARELEAEVLRPRGVRGHEGQVDLGLDRAAQLDLGLLRRLAQALQRHLVLAQVDALVLLELGHDPIDDPLVEVVPAQVRIAVGRLDLDHALPDLEDGDVEGAAAEVVDGDGLVLLLVQAVRQRGRGGLVDDAHHLQARDLARVLGRLALRVVEVGGDGDDGLGHLLTEVVLGRLLQLLQDHGRDLGRRVQLAADLDADVAVGSRNDLVRDHLHFLGHLRELAPHEALDRVDRVLRIGDGLALRHLADQPLALFRERHDGGGDSAALRVGNHGGRVAFEDGDDRVRRPQIDADHLAHCSRLPWTDVLHGI